MQNSFLVIAFVMGLASSMHCVGMCGPLAMSLPVRGKTFRRMALSAVLYNIGRVFTYSILGLAVGLLGEVINFATYQQGLSLMMAVGLLVFFLSPKKWRNKLSDRVNASFFMRRLRSAWGRFMKRPTALNFFMIGILNGFLPCGAVYVALAGAVTAGTVLESLLFMSFFGLGTLPALFAVVLGSSFLKGKTAARLRSALMPIGVTLLIALLLLRGLNLNIPYISPNMNGQEVNPASCCEAE